MKRICIPTLRGFDHFAFRGNTYEAEDVLAAVDEVDLIKLEPVRGYQFREHWLRRLVWKDPTGFFSSLNPGFQKVRLAREYDLLILYCQHLKDLLCVNAIENWKEACGTTICIMDELWANEVPKINPFIRCLDRFDHVAVGCKGSVEALSQAMARPVHFVPPAVDTLRFSPIPEWPGRVVDIYSMGRRHEPLHQALRRYCGKDRFYIYETLEAGWNRMRDAREHRELFASLTKRSVGFMVAPAKIDRPNETGGQVEIPNRYYEGIAAGAILLGQRPHCDYFDDFFDWPDSVVELNPEGTDLTLELDNLFGDEERRERIHLENARQALQRHDWVHRWQRVLEIAGLEPQPAMRERIAQLRQLAESGVARPETP